MVPVVVPEVVLAAVRVEAPEAVQERAQGAVPAAVRAGR